LCWHCWHLEEVGGRPQELRTLLKYARGLAAVETGAQRAREVAEGWRAFEDVAHASAAAVESRLQQNNAKCCGVLVLGGIGVSAISAAAVGATNVWVWERNTCIAAAVRHIVCKSKTVQVIEATGVEELEAAVPGMQEIQCI